MVNEKANAQEKEAVEIDIVALLKVFWKKIWLIAIAAVLCAALAFGGTELFAVPKYQSSIKMYVNNISYTPTDTSYYSIQGSSLTAAQSLVKTYIEILYMRSTLERVIDDAELTDENGKRMTYSNLKSMVSAGALNNTEIFQVLVNDTDPARAKLIANTIAVVLPDQISTVVEGSSVKIVDYAVNGVQTSPSMVKNVAIGFLVGAFLICLLETILFLTDQYIHDEEYLVETLNIPLLAVIPDLGGHSSDKYKYRKYKYGYGKYGGYHGRAYGYYQSRLAQEEEKGNDAQDNQTVRKDSNNG